MFPTENDVIDAREVGVAKAKAVRAHSRPVKLNIFPQRRRVLDTSAINISIYGKTESMLFSFVRNKYREPPARRRPSGDEDENYRTKTKISFVYKIIRD